MAPEFVPGLQLARSFYATVVRPLLAEQFPRVPYAAALLGPGSEVAGFDSPREAITDPQIKRLPATGAIDQFIDSTDAAGDLRFLYACAKAAWVGETPGRDGC